MNVNDKKLIAEIENDKIKYAVFGLNEKSNFETLIKKTSTIKGIEKGKVIDVDFASKIVSHDLKEIEEKIEGIFRNVSVIINQKEVFCTNLTGFKKLNGSKVEKRDVDYILNEGKSSIIKNQNENIILHILNSNFILDGVKQDKIPLNNFGDHLSLHMTFISLAKENLKNINIIFDNNNLKVDRVINKPFACGIDLLSKDRNLKNFVIINFDEELSSYSLYENSSLIFLKTFPFGTNSIYRDVTNLCSLEQNEIKSIVNDLNFNDFLDKNAEYLDKKFFTESDFEKISIPRLKNIITARIEEMVNYLLNKNKNYYSIENAVSNVYLFFEDENICNNLGNFFKKSINIDKTKKNSFNIKKEDFLVLRGAAELIFKGWHSEAIPIVHKKKSIISSFFSRFF